MLQACHCMHNLWLLYSIIILCTFGNIISIVILLNLSSIHYWVHNAVLGLYILIYIFINSCDIIDAMVNRGSLLCFFVFFVFFLDFRSFYGLCFVLTNSNWVSKIIAMISIVSYWIWWRGIFCYDPVFSVMFLYSIFRI